MCGRERVWRVINQHGLFLIGLFSFSESIFHVDIA